MDKIFNTVKFPFEYLVEPTLDNPEIEMEIEIPWWDEEKGPLEQMQRDVIFEDENIKVFDQLYENGFHAFFIQTPTKGIIKTNWELDEMKNGVYLPRIQ